MSDGRKLGLAETSAAVVASMIGVGIYTSPGYTVSDLGSPGWAVAAWAVGGLIALCGAAGYGALASEIAESGGEYTYLSRTVHPAAGFLAGWVSLTAGFAGAAAVAAVGLGEFAAGGGTAGAAVAAVALVGSGLLHGWRVRPAAGVQALAVAAKLAVILGCLIAVGAFAIHHGPAEQRPADVPSAGAFATSLMWIALSTSGFNAAVYFSGEVREPRRTVPRSLLWGTGVTVAIYVAIVAAVAYLPPADRVAARPDAVAETAAFVGGGAGRTLVTGLIVVSLLTSVSATAMTGARVTARMAAEGRMPRWLRCDERRPPRASLALHTAIALAIALAGPLRELIPQIGATLALSSAAAVATVVWRGRGVRRLAAAAFVAATLLSFAISVRFDPMKAVGAAAVLLSGGVAWLAVRRSGKAGGTGSNDSAV